MSATRITELTPIEIDPKTASRAWWREYHAYRRQRQHEVRPDDPLMPDDVLEEQMKKDDPFMHRRLYCIDAGESLLSTFSVTAYRQGSPGHDSNKHLLQGVGDVLKEWRRQGLGRRWVTVILELMEQYGCTVFTTTTEEEDGHTFLKWLGAEGKMSQHENRLDIAKVDWQIVRRWVEEGERRNPSTRLSLYEERVPAELLPKFCAALTAMANTAPFEELDHGDEDFTPEIAEEQYERLALVRGATHVYITEEPDGELSGLTMVFYLPFEEDRIRQAFTGVATAHQGRGLGKWMKAAMLEYVRDKYPVAAWVITGNAYSNEPMLEINHKLGFRPYRGSTTYQISKQKLEDAVARP